MRKGLKSWTTILYLTLTSVGCVHIKVEEPRPPEVAAVVSAECKLILQHALAKVEVLRVNVKCSPETKAQNDSAT